MSEKSTVLLTIKNNIAEIVLNRPEKLNALNTAIFKRLNAIFNGLEKEDSIRVIVLKGVGERAFCAGADVSNFKDGTQKELIQKHENFQKIFLRIQHFNKPVIAQLHGFVLGGGAELALAAHIRIAATDLSLGFPEVDLGLLPGYGGTKIAKMIGQARAFELLLTGKKINATEALKYGLINEICPRENLEKTVKKTTDTLVKKSPEAMKKIIQCINFSSGLTKEHMDFERGAFNELLQSDTAQKSIKNFVKK